MLPGHQYGSLSQRTTSADLAYFDTGIIVGGQAPVTGNLAGYAGINEHQVYMTRSGDNYLSSYVMMRNGTESAGPVLLGFQTACRSQVRFPSLQLCLFSC